MITNLENEYIVAQVNSLGAELCSMQLKKDETEYIWQADKKYWARHAPVLFPIVGRLLNNEYVFDDKTYHLSQHGFARDIEFELIFQETDYLEYRLLSNEVTLKQYPCNFELIIAYRLIQNELIIEYKVKNRNNKVMYFSIGAHPGFRCPLLSEECFEDYYLEFSQKETSCRYPLEKGLLVDRTEAMLDNDCIMPLTYDLFKDDALVFKELKSDTIILKSKKSSKMVRVKFAGFPYLGIWAKDGAPFICIEPWYGIADREGEKIPFFEKEGICFIEPEEWFSCQYSISIY